MTPLHPLLTRLAELREKATKGPWGLIEVEDKGAAIRYQYTDDQGRRVTAWPASCMSTTLPNRANAALIVEAVNALPDLIAALEAKDAENANLVADLAKFDADISCESCAAPLFDSDDFVSSGDCSGCWAAMTDAPSKRERPCYAYRVGKPSAARAAYDNLRKSA